MSLFVPSSQYKPYLSYDFNGRPATDASFRHVFAQAQAPMLLEETGGGGAGTVITEFPNIGDGSASNPVTFAPAPACGRTFFYNGSAWQHNRNTGITEVTVGDTTTGANFATLQEALNCSPFVRVVNDVTVTGVLTFPSANILIYVDPGVTLTFNVNVPATRTSVTFRGSASISSSNIVFRAALACDANTRLYFYDCRVQNSVGRSLITTSTDNYGSIEGYHCSFVASNVQNSLFGEGNGTEIIVLELQDCAIQGGGDGCEYVIGSMDPSRSVIHLRGVTISSTQTFRDGGFIADTNVYECILSDIHILAPILTNPYQWTTSGAVSNFKQTSDGSSLVNLNFAGNEVQATNIFVNAFSLNAQTNVLSNLQTTTAGTISIGVTGTKLSNATFAGSLSLDETNCEVSNCSCVRLFITRSGNSLNNVRSSATTALNGVSTCLLNNVYAAGGFTFTDSSVNHLNNCRTSSTSTLDITSNGNTFTGGVYDKVTVDGQENTFTGINFLSTFTVSPGANFTQASNCRAQQVSWAGADGVLTNLEVTTNIGLSASLSSPRCIIMGCRTGTGGVATGDIDVKSNQDVVITNCIVGSNPLPASSIINILTTVAVPPFPAGPTLISNCKTRVAIAASTAVTNCGLF